MSDTSCHGIAAVDAREAPGQKIGKIGVGAVASVAVVNGLATEESAEPIRALMTVIAVPVGAASFTFAAPFAQTKTVPAPKVPEM
jgi:hypothetical protein